MDNFCHFARHGIRALLLSLASSVCMGAALAGNCSPSEADAAQAALDGIDSWGKLAQAQRRFAHCDTASVAEGNSEAVARLLVDQWTEVPMLAAVAAKHPEFMPFVLRHVDTTLDTVDLERIAQLAKSRCPSKNGTLCRSLAAAANRALLP